MNTYRWITYNVGIAIINHTILMVHTTHLWWLGGWFIIAIPTLSSYEYELNLYHRKLQGQLPNQDDHTATVRATCWANPMLGVRCWGGFGTPPPTANPCLTEDVRYNHVGNMCVYIYIYTHGIYVICWTTIFLFWDNTSMILIVCLFHGDRHEI